MSTPIETSRNLWVLPALILWGFAPAILITTSIIGGWYRAELGIITPARSAGDPSPLGVLLIQVAIFGMPIILYPWSVSALLWFGVKLRVKAALFGIPLTLAMCAANVFLGMAGCTGLSNIIPEEGIF